MKIRDLLAAESIELNGKVTGKKEALDAMVDLMAKSGKINDVEVYRKGVYAREEESTTGIGEGIAIPHCNRIRYQDRDLQLWLYRKGLTLIP